MNGLPTLVFQQQFTVISDVVITIDYSSQTTDITLPGGILIGFIPIDQITPLGMTDLSGLNYISSTSTGILSGQLGVAIDFGGTFALSSNNYDGLSASSPNSISIRGSQVDEFPLVYTTKLTNYPLLNTVSNRLRIRLTDFGQTIIVDAYNFNTFEFNTLVNAPYIVQTLSAVKVYCSIIATQSTSLSVTNINLNGYTLD